MKKISIFIVLAILGTFFTSCENDLTSPINKVNYFDLIEAGQLYEGDWNGYISIQGRKMFGDSEMTRNNAQNTATARFWDKNGTPLAMDGVIVGDINLTPVAEQNMTYKVNGRERQATKHLFGTTTTVKLSANGRNDDGSVELYCPPELIISEPVKTYVGIKSIGRQVLIQWNADYENDKGVGIAVSYSQSGKNQNLSVPSSSTSVLVEDDGEHTLTLSENTPNDAVVTIYIIRGDIQGLDMDEQTYLTTCYTMAYSEFKLTE